MNKTCLFILDSRNTRNGSSSANACYKYCAVLSGSTSRPLTIGYNEIAHDFDISFDWHIKPGLHRGHFSHVTRDMTRDMKNEQVIFKEWAA